MMFQLSFTDGQKLEVKQNKHIHLDSVMQEYLI